MSFHQLTTGKLLTVFTTADILVNRANATWLKAR